jgi:anti-sigma factor RsiW
MTTDVEALSCQELVELVTDYFEGALAPDERARVEQHLDTCAGCRRYVEQLRTTIELAGRLGREDLSPEAEDALLDAFRTWKAAAG